MTIHKHHLSVATIRRSLLLLSLILFTAVDARGQYDSTYFQQFTDLKVGDSISPLENSPDVDGYIYAFVDASSCGTCLATWMHDVGEVSRRHQIRIVVFITGQTQEFADIERQQHGWPFMAIGDPKYLFSRYYHVKLTPFYFVSDSRGIVRGMDKCGGVRLTTQTIESVLLESRNRRTSSQQTALSEESRKVIRTRDGRPLDVGDRHFVIFNAQTSRYCLLDAGIGLMHIIDSTGLVMKTMDLRSRAPYAMARLRPSWVAGDSVALHCRQDMNANLAFDLIDFGSDTIKTIQFHDSLVSLPASPFVMHESFFNLTSNQIIVALHPIDRGRRMRLSDRTLMFLTETGRCQFTGAPDSLFLRRSMTPVWDCQIGFDQAGRIYEIQSPSPRVRIYSGSGELIRTVDLKVDTSWRVLSTDITKPTPSDWIVINGSMSFVQGIYPDRDGSGLAVTYRNYDYPPGSTDPRSRQATVRTYLHRTAPNGTPAARDILLPINDIIHVDETRIGGLHYANRNLAIVWYRFP